MLTYLALILVVSAPVIVYSLIHRQMLKSRYGYQILPVYVFLVAIGFFIFEIFAVQNEWWSFNSSNTLGVTIASVPVEEIAFFILIPQICLFLWALLRVKHPWANLRDMAKHHLKTGQDE